MPSLDNLEQNHVYLVTGGAGFIGSHTAEALLNRKDSVVVVDEVNDYYSLAQKHENIRILYETAEKTGAYFKFYKGSCEDAQLMAHIFRTEGITRVCHLAARAGVRPSIKDPHLYVQANITATLTLLDLARDYKINNFVYASSSSVYGKNTKVPFAESDRTDNPVSPYAATKKTCELLAHTYNNLYSIPTTGLRFFTVYGPRGRPDMAPFMFFDRISQGVPINQFGDGSSCRDYTFIADIVSGVLAALDRPSAHAAVYNLGNSATVSLKEFISVIEDTAGRKALIRLLPDQPGDVPLTYADLSLSFKELGYQPTTSIREGMRIFADWYRSMNAHSAAMQSSESTDVTPRASTLASPVAHSGATAQYDVSIVPPPSPPLSEEGMTSCTPYTL